ncbi:PadR family transcriptional regulator [Clostridium swellfunianum]|uniref:PadR family transcriptional regulator n=1 Tax=Clostridium swellfunianum TaxID=1367462 RepID=UPI00202E7D0B|nr:PadR family transcriptional regulator [Clostridium swellfunianum]MCM0648058.1 PadR family transcriptional regulator [Clostridium swellfunianum]
MDTQLKKGILEMCILFQLTKNDMYGYEIMKIIKDVFPDVYDGSIYAILRRLNADGHTETYMRESTGGPQRKYYRVTTEGKNYCLSVIEEWNMLKNSVETLGI